MSVETPEYMSVSEVAKALGFSRPHIYKLMVTEGLPYMMFGKRRRIAKSDLLKFVESKRIINIPNL